MTRSADRPAANLGAFALVLAGIFGTAYAIGERVPGHQHQASATTGHDDQHATGVHDHAAAGTGSESAAGHEHGDNGAGAGVAGLSSVVDGFQVVVVEQPAESQGTLRLAVERDGGTVTAFDERHGARLHLIVVSPDLASYQHLHPLMGTDGVWSVPFAWQAGGVHRLVVDVAPSGAEPVALGTDIVSPLPAQPSALPGPADDVTTPEGLRVTRDGGRFTVAPVDGLEPYLGQPAHLVAFRSGNLAYRHLHASSPAPGTFDFTVDLPAGTWRLFLQFSRLGEVITVPFTVEVP